MRQAADREDRTEKHVAMENRLSPMRELLGELLLQAGKPTEARREFALSLEPGRTDSARRQAQPVQQRSPGRRAQSRSYYRQLLALARDADSAAGTAQGSQ